MNPKIDIVLLTHNHASYIEACLRSVVDQTIFKQIRLILCEDASTDGTAKICERYADQHPQIQLFSHTENLGFSKNMAFGLRQIQAPFFALMDGDDYYIDTEKLERQLEFLESNPDFVAVAHDVVYLTPEGEETEPEIEHHSGELSPAHWTGYRPFHTNTFLARQLTDFKIEQWEPFFLSSDQVIIHLLHQQGRVMVCPDRLTAYRKHPEGYSVKIDKVQITRNLIRLMKAMNEHSGGRYSVEYNRSLSRYYADLFRFTLQRGKWDIQALFLHYLYGIKGNSVNLKRIPWIIKNHYASN